MCCLVADSKGCVIISKTRAGSTPEPVPNQTWGPQTRSSHPQVTYPDNSQAAPHRICNSQVYTSMVHFGNPGGQILEDQASKLGACFRMPRIPKAGEQLDHQRLRRWAELRTKISSAFVGRIPTLFGVRQTRTRVGGPVDCSRVLYQRRWWWVVRVCQRPTSAVGRRLTA